MAAWQTLAINGVVADTLVDAFGGNTGTAASLPRDQRLCLRVDYSSDAQTQVIIYLAIGAGSADQNLVMLYDSRQQVVPAADSTQWVTDLTTSVPIFSSLPMQLRISKGNSNAVIRWESFYSMGPGGC